MSDSTPAAADQEVLITRIFDAPRERVFRAWTDPDEVAEWFGPAHMDTPRDRIRIDLRVGGRYELTMVRRDGGAEFSIAYEIVELVRVELHDHGDKTRMTLSDSPHPPASRGHAEAGWTSAFDKLAELVAG
jgi:uncharacterized protein YndB with AHSA1/START domain